MLLTLNVTVSVLSWEEPAEYVGQNFVDNQLDYLTERMSPRFMHFRQSGGKRRFLLGHVWVNPSESWFRTWCTNLESHIK
jgi:hypothetical protein